MSESRNIFRTFFDALIESRTREAERYLDQYRNTVDTTLDHLPKR